MWRGVGIAILLAGAARAQAPQSAIDWLSQSLLHPPKFVISPPDHSPYVTPIISRPLQSTSPDAVGILPPAVTGFPIALWAGTTQAEAAALLKTMPPLMGPELVAVFKQVLLAQSDPPAQDTPPGALLLARLDRLIAMGALDEAETLILQAGPSTPELFRRWFDITVIAHRTKAPCAALKDNPALSDDISTRVICLARAGDWNAAAMTASLAQSLGQISKGDSDLLLRFLDPEMFADQPDPPLPDPLGPVAFTLRESLALPRPDGPLPLSLLATDMTLRTPARQRIVAAERLLKSGAIADPQLFAAYRGSRAASSGGAWGRAEYVQKLDIALAQANDSNLPQALENAAKAFSDAQLLLPFAREYAEKLAQLPATPAHAKIAPRVRGLLVLAGHPLAQWAGLGAADGPEMRLATRVMQGDVFHAPFSTSPPLFGAIEQAFSAHPPPQQAVPDLVNKIKAGQFGYVLLTALDMLHDGRDSDPLSLQEGLYLLRKLGMEASARRVAVQLLLPPPEPA